MSEERIEEILDKGRYHKRLPSENRKLFFYVGFGAGALVLAGLAIQRSRSK